MFIQVIQGKTNDAEGLRRRLDEWVEKLGPGAQGFQGTTGGVAEDGTAVFIARFESEEAARANSDRPEQGQWWEETAKLNNSATPSVALGFAFNSEPVKTELAQLEAVGKELGEPLSFGLVDVAEGLPKLIQALKDAGAEKVVAETQRQLDEWAKTKKA